MEILKNKNDWGDVGDDLLHEEIERRKEENELKNKKKS